jgi:hypothetical protein
MNRSLRTFFITSILFIACSKESKKEMLSTDLYINRVISSKLNIKSGKKYILYIEGNIVEYEGDFTKELQVSIKNDEETLLDNSFKITSLDENEERRIEMMFNNLDSLDYMKIEFSGKLTAFSSENSGSFKVDLKLHATGSIRVNKLRVIIKEN